MDVRNLFCLFRTLNELLIRRGNIDRLALTGRVPVLWRPVDMNVWIRPRRLIHVRFPLLVSSSLRDMAPNNLRVH